MPAESRKINDEEMMKSTEKKAIGMSAKAVEATIDKYFNLFSFKSSALLLFFLIKSREFLDNKLLRVIY